MKVLLFLPLVICLWCKGYSQSLNQKEDLILSEMAKDTNYVFKGKRVSAQGLDVLQYQSKDWNKSFFFDADKSCAIISFLYEKKNIPRIFSLFDNLPDVVKIGDLKWFDTHDRTNIEVKIQPDNELFQVLYTKQ